MCLVPGGGSPWRRANGGGVPLQGVVEFSLCLLFAKLVSYTFLFWLPLYITKAGEYRAGANRKSAPVLAFTIKV